MHQYLSHLWLFAGLETMLSLWCGFISLRPQPRMVASCDGRCINQFWWQCSQASMSGWLEKLIEKKDK